MAEDFKTMLRIARAHWGKLTGLVVIVGIGALLVGGEEVQGVSISPDASYRLEYFRPPRYQWLINWRMDDPTAVRLYRNYDNAYFGESQVVDMFLGGESIWLIEVDGTLSVGMDILFTGIPPVEEWRRRKVCDEFR